MADTLDLLLQGTGDGESLQASLASAGGLHSFALVPPQGLQRAYQAWRDRFLAHHNGTAVSAEAVQHYAAQLLRLLAGWLQNGSWQPLQQATGRAPQAPLRLRFQQVPPWIEQLPWEELAADLQRPIWRLAEPTPTSQSHTPVPRRQRQPRLLLLVGDETNLTLEPDIDQLQRLQRFRRIQLTTLRGPACNANAIRQALADPSGWDALIFLGHSGADARAGGRLHLGDGSWLTADLLASDLQQAAQQGLALVLLNSCSGLDLARSVVAAGCQWALCFREPVPSAAASQTFKTLLEALEGGAPLQDALAKTRQELSTTGSIGTALLLSLVAAPAAQPCRLPLRKRRQLQLRLATSTRPQALAAAGALALAVLAALVPWNPVSTSLLDRRLAMQQQWRQLTNQPGPAAPPIAVLLVDPKLTSTEEPSKAGQFPRGELAALLQKLPPSQVPRVGLDVVLDRPSPQDPELAQVLRSQKRPLVVAGWFSRDAAVNQPGDDTKKLTPTLSESGLLLGKLDVNTPGRNENSGSQPLPLRLSSPLTAEHFAGLLSGHPSPLLPAEAVVDWSLNWRQLLRRVIPSELPTLKTDTLLVGSTGYVDLNHPDLFSAPGAAADALADLSGGSSREVPGVLVQAALTQTIAHRLWLTPLPLPPITALGGGLGVVVAAALETRRRRLLLLALTWLAAVPLALQLAVSAQLLWPLLLPLLTFSATVLLRRD